MKNAPTVRSGGIGAYQYTCQDVYVKIKKHACIVIVHRERGRVSQLLLRLIVIVCAAGLFGCAAREVTPVRMTQSGDEELDCTALNQQIADNRAEAEKLLRKDKQVENANTAKTIGSAIPMLGLLLAGSMDLSNEEQIKARALIDRDEWLTHLAKQKRCGE